MIEASAWTDLYYNMQVSIKCHLIATQNVIVSLSLVTACSKSVSHIHLKPGEEEHMEISIFTVC